MLQFSEIAIAILIFLLSFFYQTFFYMFSATFLSAPNRSYKLSSVVLLIIMLITPLIIFSFLYLEITSIYLMAGACFLVCSLICAIFFDVGLFTGLMIYIMSNLLSGSVTILLIYIIVEVVGIEQFTYFIDENSTYIEDNKIYDFFFNIIRTVFNYLFVK